MVTKMEMKAYLNAVKKGLRFVPGRRQAVKELQHELENYLAEKKNATMADIYAAFGTPEAIGAALTGDLRPEELKKQMDKARQVRNVALVTAGVLVLLFVLTMVGIIAWNYYTEPAFYYDKIIP